MRIDRKTGVLAGKALFFRRKTQLRAQLVHEIGGVAAVDDGVGGFEAELRRIVAQQPVADGMESACPGEALRDGLRFAAQRVVERLAQDLHRSPPHFHRSAARERQQHDPGRIDAGQNQMRDAMRKRAGLAGARAGDDEQRPGAKAAIGQRLAETRGLALRVVQRLEMKGLCSHIVEDYNNAAARGLPKACNPVTMFTMAEDTISTKFRGRVITVNVETVTLPNGAVADFEIIHHPGGAAVVAIDEQQRVCLLRQFRPAAYGLGLGIARRAARTGRASFRNRPS